MMEFLLGLLILIILLFMGMFYYRSCKKSADKLMYIYIKERDEMEKKEDEP